jgi:predicted enzyme related to lactoylglutathione lyase
MEIDQYEHGVPSWVDLGTPDPAAAGRFYAALFGWSIQTGPPESGGYAIAELEGRPVAGIGPQQNPGPPVWSTYINVDDADKVAELVASNGGQVFMAPSEVMDVGRMGIFADPAGAVFGVWQPRAHKGAGLVNQPNTLCWNELVTTDVDGAKPFYASVFGWGSDTHGEGAAAYTEWKMGGRTVGGMMAKPEQIPAEVPPHWMTYFAVTDTDAAVVKVTELGGAVMMPPMDIEPGRFAVVADPAGAVFSVITMNDTTS